MEITKVEKATKDNTKGITFVLVEAVLMPNDELIRNGKSLGFGVMKEGFKGIWLPIKE